MTPVKCFPWLVLALALSGCSTPTITNLTPSRLPRNASGLYPFEVAWDSSQQSLRKESIRPYVVVGLEPPYPMQPAPILKNRWETLVPIPAGQKFIHYQYKFDYDYNSIPVRRSNSKLSAPYQLEIIDK
jgi:hypothetical protein